jgi:hypothetical protein
VKLIPEINSLTRRLNLCRAVNLRLQLNNFLPYTGSNGAAIAMSIINSDPEALRKMASPTRDGFFSRFCAAIVESRQRTADAVINRYRHLLPPAFGNAGHDPERDESRSYNHSGVVVVGSAWLTFYVIAAIHQVAASAH